MIKFFTPTKSFLTPLFYWCITTIKIGILIWSLDMHLPTEVVKNFCGVKNFSSFDRVDSQLLPEENIKIIVWKLAVLCGKEIRFQISFFRIKMDATVRGKKRTKWFCSNFMSFSPIDFIFIGCIGYDDKFCWVLRNFDFKPANEIFSKKGKMSFFQKTCFLGYDLENGVWAKLVLWICPILWIRVKMSYTQLSLTFFYWNRPIRPIYQKIKNCHILEKIAIFWIKNVL